MLGTVVARPAMLELRNASPSMTVQITGALEVSTNLVEVRSRSYWHHSPTFSPMADLTPRACQIPFTPSTSVEFSKARHVQALCLRVTKTRGTAGSWVDAHRAEESYDWT